MKKSLHTILSLLMISVIILITASCNNDTKTESDSPANINFDKFSSDEVLCINSSELNVQNDTDSFKAFLNKGGILLVYNDAASSNSLGKNLNMQVQAGWSETDVAAIYYYYGNNLSGTYIINAQNNISSSEQEILIKKALDEVGAIQSTGKYYLADISDIALGNLIISSASYPEGTLTAKYEFFTAQNHFEKDYYTVKTTVTGNPGSVLASSNSDYESKYRGVSQNTTIKAISSSVLLDAYGPQTTDDNENYHVSIFDTLYETDKEVLKAEFNYSKPLPNATIEANCTRNEAIWNVSLEKEARNDTYVFVPAVTFSCPESKSSVDINLSSSYTVDSWNTLKKTISSNRDVTLNPAKQ